MNTLSRRQFLAAASASTIGLAGLNVLSPRTLFAAEGGVVQSMRSGAAGAEINTQALRGGVHVIMGSGGNITVFTGKEGAVLVDSGLAGSKPKLAEALKKIGAEPVTTLINTHWHFDHTDGNEWLHATGTRIIAHENVLKRMSQASTVDAWNFTFPPAPEGALPEVLLRVDRSIRANDSTIQINVLPPSHTDGDLTVRFSAADVVALGDTFWNGHYPFIDYSSGGSIDGTIAVTESNLKAIDAKTMIVPGHGPVASRAELATYRDMLVAAREKVAALKSSGKSLEETIAAQPTAATDAKWGDFVINPATFVTLVYQGV